MPDIDLRFHRDMLVLSAPVAAVLARQGFDVSQDLEYASLVEPEAVEEALRLNKIAGAQCLVTNTAGVTSARLAHHGLEGRDSELVKAGLDAVRSLQPQHLFVEIGPCGLPLDAESKASLNENRSQYAQAARACEGKSFDAFFLSGFANPTDLKCALMGISQVSGTPVIAAVVLDDEGMLLGGRYAFEEALEVMIEFEAAVVGFSTAAPLDKALEYTCRACKVASLPVLAQLDVVENNPKQGGSTPANPYYCPDTLIEAGVQLRGAGAQFLRAGGAATPAYTGALVAVSEGFDVMRPDIKE